VIFAKFSHLVVFNAPAEGVSVNGGWARKKLE